MTGSAAEQLVRVFLVLDDVSPASIPHYAEWQRNVLVPALTHLPGTARVVAFRAVDEMPGGVARGLVFPPFMTIVELKTADGIDLDQMRRAASDSLPDGVTPVTRHAYAEFNRGQRSGAFLSQPRPRTTFLIGQHVASEKEAEYNYWFDVDDRKSAPGAEKVSHYKERLLFPGFVRATRLRYDERQPPRDVNNRGLNYLALYEVDGPDALQTESYLSASKRPADRLGLFTLVVRRTYLEVPS